MDFLKKLTDLAKSWTFQPNDVVNHLSCVLWDYQREDGNRNRSSHETVSKNIPPQAECLVAISWLISVFIHASDFGCLLNSSWATFIAAFLSCLELSSPKDFHLSSLCWTSEDFFNNIRELPGMADRRWKLGGSGSRACSRLRIWLLCGRGWGGRSVTIAKPFSSSLLDSPVISELSVLPSPVFP